MGRLKRIPAWIGTITALLGFVLPILAVARMWVMAGGNVASFRLLTTTNMFSLLAVTLYEGVTYLIPLILLIIWRLLPIHVYSVWVRNIKDRRNHPAIAFTVGVTFLITGFFLTLGVWVALVIVISYIIFHLIRTPVLPETTSILLLPSFARKHSERVATPRHPPAWFLVLGIVLCTLSFLARSWLPLESISLNDNQGDIVHPSSVMGYVVSEDEVGLDVLLGTDGRVYRIPHTLVKWREICPPKMDRYNPVLSYPPFVASDWVYDQVCFSLEGELNYSPSVAKEVSLTIHVVAFGVTIAWSGFFYISLLLRPKSNVKGRMRWNEITPYLIASVVIGLIFTSSFASSL